MSKAVARQPIFDKSLKIYAYELLFRGEALDSSGEFDHDKATSSVLYDGLFAIGLDNLTNGKSAFVNFSRGMLTSDMTESLPKDQITIEILEHVEPDEMVMLVCEKLRKSGYQLALDDFPENAKPNPLVQIADIIKVDILNSSAKHCAEVPILLADGKRRFLAEKIETYAQYRQAVDWGYTLFQGFFFCKPQMVDTREIRGNKLVYFQLIKAMQDPEITMEKLEQIIQQDLSLSYAIIKYINSAAIGLRTKVQSVKHALTMLGIKKVREFSTLILFKKLGEDKPSELVVTSLIRGRFSELLATRSGLRTKTGEAFLTGIFSLIDALLDRPMEKILAELNLNEDITAALQNRPGPLTSILQTVIAYEQADWGNLEVCRHALGPACENVQEMYFEAVSWAEEIIRQG